jgi:hypothetical protein
MCARALVHGRAAHPSGNWRHGSTLLVRHPASQPVRTHARGEARLTHRKHPAGGNGELRGMNCLGAPTRRGRPHARIDWPAAKFGARVGVRGPQPCLRTRGLAAPARHSHLVTRGASRSGAAAHHRPLQKGPRLDNRHSHETSSRSDGELRSMSGP